ncbi:unnamed protein product [Prorocentrum cordatum]|uniref:Uncharacterized protein n=1 Tax=Prorocentrum cordatum TaxID=2364126 RepID=A0ABN9TN46_9DINO|nr:unnamed protein product [Polarella glacialis]
MQKTPPGTVMFGGAGPSPAHRGGRHLFAVAHASCVEDRGKGCPVAFPPTRPRRKKGVVPGKLSARGLAGHPEGQRHIYADVSSSRRRRNEEEEEEEEEKEKEQGKEKQDEEKAVGLPGRPSAPRGARRQPRPLSKPALNNQSARTNGCRV